MYKLSIDLDRKLTIMSKHDLNAEEWLFIEMLWLADQGQPEYLFKYFNECAKTCVPLDTLQSLKDKKVFASSYKVPKPGEDFEYDQVEFSKTFTNNYFKDSFEAGRELYRAYPKFIQDSDMQLCANNIVTKGGYRDENDFFAKYQKAIQNKRENHEQVMQSLAWAKEQKLIKYSIVEYVVTRKWEDHIEMQNSGEINSQAYKVETMEDLN